MVHLVGDPEVKDEISKFVSSILEEFARADASPGMPGTWHTASGAEPMTCEKMILANPIAMKHQDQGLCWPVEDGCVRSVKPSFLRRW